MNCACGYMLAEEMDFCPKCGRRVSSHNSADSEVPVMNLSVDKRPSRESLREVRAEGRARKVAQKRNKALYRRRKSLNFFQRIRLGISGLLSLAVGIMLLGSSGLPWATATMGTLKFTLGAGDIFYWLPMYAIGAGLAVVWGAMSRSEDLRTWLGLIALISVGISAYIWSQLNSLLNLVGGFTSLFGSENSNAEVSDYLQPQIGLFLWLGSIVLGIVAYLAKDS
jgi:hypothetical protein